VAITHTFQVSLRAYSPEAPTRMEARAHVLMAQHKPPLKGSSAPTFHGDQAKWNPEELFAAALAQCHYLSYVYVAGEEGLTIHSYTCTATAHLVLTPEGGQIGLVELIPEVTVAPEDEDLAQRLHDRAHEECFIARSVSCEVTVSPRVHTVS
jgi:Predicted redox protein, regulator of disulfide bond formation